MLTLLFLILLPVIIIGTLIFFATAPQIGGKPAGTRMQRIRTSPGYKNGKFQNVIPTTLDMSFRKMLRVLIKMFSGEKNKVPSAPIHTMAFDKQQFNKLGNGNVAAIVWFGHTSLLIKIHGKVFLTDPVLVGKRASMISFIGPKRFSYTHHIELNELPFIDVVLLSHDHYDHLDYPTMLKLKDIAKQFIVPLGVGVHLEKWGVPPSNISEHDWWNKFSFDENITLICTPSRHFSGRSITGRNTTLWCSWIISGLEQRIYFGADSGYSPSFKEIGTRYGPFDLCILECGAYSEYWHDIHMLPEETNQANIDLGGKKLLPVHWAKFNLSLHAWREPIRRLKKQAALTGVTLVTPRITQAFEVGVDFKQDDWWELEQ
jgi:L-ascorbate metabolism protein UlaG (beta-lactamase superfamily)